MGMKGKRPNLSHEVEMPVLPKRPHSTDEHRRLCLLAAKLIHRRGCNINPPSCPYVVVELVTCEQEIPDVFGWNYWTTVLIEVKVSRSDFLADKKKWFRIYPEKGMGDYRYYCCPDGLIKENELPEKWGLLYEKDGVITVIKKAEISQVCLSSERSIYASIFRRENIKPRIFDYRKSKDEIKTENKEE